MTQAPFTNLSTLWDDICNLIIRPQRAVYEPNIALGPKLFTLGNKIYERTDIVITNARNLKLQCSHYQPIPSQRITKKLPCVIYLHGNCGSRCDALDAVQILLPSNITVLAFDFSGSGLSEGEYVSLGFYEKQDVAAVVEYLWKTGTVSRIGLWGRSMGAATSIMYAAEDHTIAGIVVDSPFTSLEDIMIDLVTSYKSWIPKAAIKIGINAIRRSILNKAHFDIRKNSPISCVKNCFIPALFAHAEGDDFIKIKHSEKLVEAYSGDKNIIKFEGDHNSERPEFFYDSVSIFFYNTLISNDPELTKQNTSINKTDVEPVRISRRVNSKIDELYLDFDDVDSSQFGTLPTTPPRNQIIPPKQIPPFESVSKQEQDEINMALIESIKDQLAICKDDNQIKELKAQLLELEKLIEK